MTGIQINLLPETFTVSGVNDFVAVDKSNGTGGYTTAKARAALVAGLNPVATLTAIEFIATANAGYALATGLQGYLVAPYAGIINGYTLLGTPQAPSTSGTLVLDVWKCGATVFDAGVTHPVLADSICGATPPSLASNVISSSNTLTGWTVAFNAGDIFAFNIRSTNNKIMQLTLALSVTKTSTP